MYSLARSGRLALCLAYIALSFVALPVFADSSAGVFGDAVSGTQLKNGEIGFDDIPKMINAATTFVLGFAATASVLAIIYGGFQLSLFSGALGGGPDGKQKGKTAIQFGLTGFLVAVSSWLIVQIIISNL